MNSIFHEDSNVLKILADKKVYDEPEGSNLSTSQGSEGPNLGQIKHDALEMLATSDNFFMTNWSFIYLINLMSQYKIDSS